MEIHGNRPFLSPTMLHDVVIVKSYVEYYLVWFVWKEEDPYLYHGTTQAYLGDLFVDFTFPSMAQNAW